MSCLFNVTNINLVPGLFYTIYSGYMNDNSNYFNINAGSLLPPTTLGTSGINNQGLITQIPDISTGTNNFISGNSYTFSTQWLGYFKSNYNGEWTFYTNSDDCSYLWIGSNAISDFTTGNAIVNNRGIHGPQEQSGKISLNSGEYYPIRIQYGQNNGGQNIIVSFSNSTLTKTSDGTNFYYYMNNGVMRP